MRRAAQIDANQPEIVAVLRQCGCSVQDTSGVGQGFPDLIVAFPGAPLGMCVPVEIKDGSKSPSRRLLTRDQKIWHAAWRGKAHVIETVTQALDLVAYYQGRYRRAG